MQPIAYFSAEYAFDDLPIFAGGLGVLATDYLMRVAEDTQPFVMIGLFYHYGFENADGSESAKLDPLRSGWELVTQNDEPLRAVVTINAEKIAFQAWTKSFGNSRVYLIDCDLADNPDNVKALTNHLYAADFEQKVVQDALLGLGGVELLDRLGITPQLYHLNEGHSALAILALLKLHRRQKKHATLQELCQGVQESVVATKHTVLSAAGLYITHNLFLQIFSTYLAEAELPLEEVFAIAQDPLRKDEFSTTRLMLELSRDVNAVSRLHAVYEKKNHPNSPYTISSITNGIHLPRWQDEAIAQADTPDALWQAHSAARRRLIDFVNDRTKSQLDPEVLTVVWARRITAYKRPLELFNDINALQHLMNSTERPVQIIIAGKPNSEDEAGVDMARRLGEHALNTDFQGKLVYLQSYDLEIARYLVQGADVWLNTPDRGYEASGTSGMKAGSNGVLQCSVSDGWVDEVKLEMIGWKLPDVNAADAIYGHIEHEIASLFYERNESGIPEAWCKLMEQTIKVIEKDYTTTRMLEEYKQQLYRLG
ncbi:MAG: alpha-glucan family phosphorylase [Candidatus Saccharimonadales bacterium]